MTHSEWYCICGQPWYGTHEKQYRRDSRDHEWRDALCRMSPWKQWVRESMPEARVRGNEPGFSYGCDDGIMSLYDRPGKGGPLALVEVKTFGKACGTSDRVMMQDLETPRFLGSLFIQLHGGNVPTRLKHFPAQRPDLDRDAQPEIPTVATSIRIVMVGNERGQPYWNDQGEVLGTELAAWLYDYLAQGFDHREL